MDNPTLFRAGAALSGDYNLPSMPAERINIAMYGPLSQHPERWKGPENPMDRLRDLKTPLYLGHGALDNVVEAAQTQKFYEALRALQPQLPLELHIEGDAGHDFSYWASETDSVLRFFERYR
jgi:dipeptidyl aminopeptidase/acylaminoacyl peptidase